MNRPAVLFVSALFVAQIPVIQAASPTITAEAASKIVDGCVAAETLGDADDVEIGGGVSGSCHDAANRSCRYKKSSPGQAGG